MMPGSPLVAEHFKVYPEQPPELLHHLGVHICKVLLLLTLPVISTQNYTKNSTEIIKQNRLFIFDIVILLLKKTCTLLAGYSAAPTLPLVV